MCFKLKFVSFILLTLLLSNTVWAKATPALVGAKNSGPLVYELQSLEWISESVVEVLLSVLSSDRKVDEIRLRLPDKQEGIKLMAGPQVFHHNGPIEAGKKVEFRFRVVAKTRPANLVVELSRKYGKKRDSQTVTLHLK